MSGIGGIVRWDGQPVNSQQITGMMNRIRHRGPDGISVFNSGMIGLGHAALALHTRDQHRDQPLWLPDKSRVIVADARIYNRDKLLSRLRDVRWLHDDPSDAAVILAAYERWQSDCLDFLDGDFAFTIWDVHRRQLFGARDPFGTKPFFYFAGNDLLAFASEPKQILALPDIPLKLDDLTIGEYLFAAFQNPQKTFFEGIRRLQPGHFLLASVESAIQQRWWNPQPQRQIQYANEEQYFDQFRELLRESVKKRLTSDYPLGIHLSGGRDSSSIVVLTADICCHDSIDAPAIETISAVYGNLSCDESPFIESVNKKVPFRNHAYNPAGLPYVPECTEDFWQVDAPIGSVQRNFTVGGAQVMRSIGARVLLDGVGGDEVTHEVYYLRDIAKRKRYLKLIKESWLASKTTRASFSDLLRDALIAAAPKSLKSAYARFRSPSVWQPPLWANQDLGQLFMEQSDPVQFNWSRYESLTQGLIYWQFTDPYFSWGQEVADTRASYAGYEHRHPYCDRALVEFVMAIPFEHRISGGQWRYLQLRGLKDYLPVKIIKRRDQTTFEEYVLQILETAVPSWRRILFESGSWESTRYVNREVALQLFKSYTPTEDVLGDTLYLWRIAFVELWLRQLKRYKSIYNYIGYEQEQICYHRFHAV